MARSVCEEEIVLREWAPLTDLFKKLPARIQNGLFNIELRITCVDVTDEYIVIGTSSGIIYLYDRFKTDIQRLRCENGNSPISKVKIVSSVDYMVACGSNDGNVTIFQIPKTPPESLPESLRPINKPVERYTVSAMHAAPITAIEWSKNGMKLFSGDENGVVVLTEIDDYMHLCKSAEILNEAYRVVQLSYHQQSLLVSTVYRTTLCRKADKWQVSQVGKKDRKIYGLFGALFYRNGIGPKDIIIYCSRPGLRIWVADINGSVQKTLLYKEIVCGQDVYEIPLLNPLPLSLENRRRSKESSFGPLIPFCEHYLLTYNHETIYILCPQTLKVIAVVNHLRGVQGVSVNKHEIFVLEGDRSLIRIGFEPETSLVSNINSVPLKSPMRTLIDKLQTTTILQASSPLPPEPNGFVSRAEEAKESPINKYNPPNQSYAERIQESFKKLEIYDKISEEEFDETILFKRGRKKKPDMQASIYSNSSNSSDEREVNVIKPTVMNTSLIDVPDLHSTEEKGLSQPNVMGVKNSPDLQSPNSVQSDILRKEKLLADFLNFDTIIPKHISKNETDCDNKSVENIDSKNLAIDLSQEMRMGSSVKDKVNSEIKKEINKVKEEVKKVDKEEVKKVDKEDVKKVDTVGNNKEIGKVKEDIIQIPACIAMPADWNIRISLNPQENLESSDSFTDWEII